jgi:uridine phosphorylase
LSTHLRPTAMIAADVLLPGDPGLALALGQELLEKPLMANHSHGLWGYSGHTASGHELTIQAIGIGGPSAAIVLAELAEHGARRAISVGRCRALDAQLALGTIAVATRVIGADGTSRSLGAEPVPDPELTAALVRLARPAAKLTIASFDSLGELAAGPKGPAWRQADAAAVDLESAALLALGARLGLRVACGLAVTQSASEELDEPATERALMRLGVAAASALGETTQALRGVAEPRRC